MRSKLHMLFAVVLAVFTGSAQAQTDVTSQYLTNAGFDDSPNYLATAEAANLGSANGGANVQEVAGWTRGIFGDNSASSTFEYGYSGTLNVSGTSGTIPEIGYEGSMGAALGMSVAWSAQLTYYQEVTLPAGVYQLEYAAYNSGPNATNTSLVGWSIPSTEASTLSELTSFPMGEWTTDVVEFTVAKETAGIIQVGIASPNVGSGSVGRIFVDHVKLVLVKSLAPVVTPFDPVEVTENITNPAFDNNNAEGWTTTGSPGVNYHEVEYYQSGFDFYQTVSGLTPGDYTLKVQALQRPGWNDAGAAYKAGAEVIVAQAYATAQDATGTAPFSSLYRHGEVGTGDGYANGFPNTMATAEVAFNNAYYDNEVKRIQVGEDGTVTIGVKAEYDGSVPAGTWSLFDNFRLFYNGTPGQAILADYEVINAIFENDATDHSVASESAFQAALDRVAALFLSEETTDSTYLAEYAALDAALKAFETSIEDYATLQAAIETAHINKANYAEFSGYAAFDAAITAAQTAYDNGTANSTSLQTLNAAERVCRLTDPSGDYTFTVINPTFDENVLGWTSATDAQNKGFVGGQEGALTGGALENWKPTATITGKIYQVIPDMPNGKYLLKMAAYARGTETEEAVFVYLNDAKTEVLVQGTNVGAYYEVEALVTNGQLEIGLSFEKAVCDWAAIDNISLQFLGDPNQAPVAPAPVKPVTDGSYMVYNPAATKYLTNNSTDPAAAALNDFSTENQDAFVWNVKVMKAELETDVDTVSMQQLSTDYYFSSGANNWSTSLYEAGDANLKNWLLRDVEEGYNFSSLKNTGKLLGIDAVTGTDIPLYFDKDATKRPLYQFFDADAFLAYAPSLVLYQTKEVLRAQINTARELLAGVLGGTHTAEEDAALNAALNEALTAYTNGEITQEDLDAVVTASKTAITTYQYATVGTEENPADFTFAVVNPTFDSNFEGWTSTTDAANKTLASNKTGAFTGTFFENWKSSAMTGTIEQTITDLPDGKYEVQIAAFAQAFGGAPGEEGAHVFLNEENTPVDIEVDGVPKFYTATALVSDGTIKIGLSIAIEANVQWIGIDNISLKYFGGAGLIINEQEALVAALDSAKNLSGGESAMLIVMAEKLALDAAIADGEPVVGSIVLEELQTATAALEAAIADANTSIMLCQELAVVYLEGLDRLDPDKFNYDETDGATFRAVLDENYAIYQNQTEETDNAAILAAKAAIEAAYAIFKEASGPIGINSAEADSVKVYSQNGTIVVDGAENYEIYDAAGRLVAEGAYAIGQVYYVRVNGASVGIMIVK